MVSQEITSARLRLGWDKYIHTKVMNKFSVMMATLPHYCGTQQIYLFRYTY